ncbi:LADA_0C08196g1_1 [Lachancea dasiensis]|uniref:Genetic interactor of prohibitins 3, mitochondrial n=1 Tax=Lachancea dasiensis TaxID=1072105 RepID=A0A1G4IZV6_9SACH|nr:LADA_0C08196g1_1 [Lachancea dasiensis]
MYRKLGKLAAKNGARCVRRFKSCNACGVHLQSADRSKIGFYIAPKTSQRPQEHAQLQDLKELKYLLFSQDLRTLQDENILQHGGNIADRDRNATGAHSLPRDTRQIVCKRCSDALHQNRYEPHEFRAFSAAEVHDFVPQNANVFHVVSLSQFPLHFNGALFTDPNYSSALLLSKGDLLTPDKAFLQRKAPRFFADFLKAKLGLPSSPKVVAFSATRSWNIQSVFSVLRGDSYLLGSPNSGKSTLVNSLLKKYGGAKVDSDERGIDPATCQYHSLREQGAGVSHIPNMTRNLQSYNIGNKTINDLPGFSENVDEERLDEMVNAKVLERIRKTHLFSKSKLVNQSYASVKGTDNGHCYTVSGLFYLVPPPNTINQVVNFIPGNEKQYRDIDKALLVATQELSTSSSGTLKQYVGVKESLCRKENFTRHVIPPFQGTVEIVLKDIGFLQLKATGRYQFSGLYEIWVPKNVQVCVREPLARLIETCYDNHLKSQGSIPSFQDKRPVISLTYPMEPDEKDVFSKMREMFLQRTQNEILSRQRISEDPKKVVAQLHREAPNLYWFYKW